MYEGQKKKNKKFKNSLQKYEKKIYDFQQHRRKHFGSRFKT